MNLGLCRACCYYRVDTKRGLTLPAAEGRCHFLPPAIFGQPSNEDSKFGWRFPVVLETDFCSMWTNGTAPVEQ